MLCKFYPFTTLQSTVQDQIEKVEHVLEGIIEKLQSEASVEVIYDVFDENNTSTIGMKP